MLDVRKWELDKEYREGIQNRCTVTGEDFGLNLAAAQNAKTIREEVAWLRLSADGLEGGGEYTAVTRGILLDYAVRLEQAAIAAYGPEEPS